MHTILRRERRRPLSGRRALPATIDSADGVLSFELTKAPVGVHVKRTCRRATGQIDCSVVFDDEASFIAWVAADQMRFSYALVFQQLTRRFGEFVEEGGHHDAFHA